MPELIPLRDRPATLWPVVARPRQPYTFRQIEVVDSPRTVDSNYEILVLNGPIHPHLLSLEAGNADSFLNFVTQLGLDEILRWITGDRHGQSPAAWRRVVGAFEVGHRQIDRQTLIHAWEDTETARRYTDDRLYLLDLIELLTALEGDKDAYETVLDIYQEMDLLRIEFWVMNPSQGQPQLIERPHDIFARAAFEFLDGLTDRGLFPRTCPYCSNPFMPTRSNQRHCPGTDHQQRGSDKKRAGDARRREYARLYQRVRRARTDEQRAKAEAELDQWREG